MEIIEFFYFEIQTGVSKRRLLLPSRERRVAGEDDK
jgi:hypothetical protein